MNKQIYGFGVPEMGGHATTYIAHRITRMALLRIVAIARYYFSSRLARHVMRCTLQAVQLRSSG